MGEVRRDEYTTTPSSSLFAHARLALGGWAAVCRGCGYAAAVPTTGIYPDRQCPLQADESAEMTRRVTRIATDGIRLDLKKGQASAAKKARRIPRDGLMPVWAGYLDGELHFVAAKHQQQAVRVSGVTHDRFRFLFSRTRDDAVVAVAHAKPLTLFQVRDLARDEFQPIRRLKS